MAAYLIGHITINDSKLWKKYVEGVKDSLALFKAEIMFRGKRANVYAGEHPFHHVVVIAFPDQSAIEQWYQSENYQKLIPIRNKAADVMLISYDA